MMHASLDQAQAFRLSSHHLAARLAPGALLQAAGACGIQNTPPGTAVPALHARLPDLIEDDLERALTGEKALLQCWSLRAAPHLFPAGDMAIFTAGLLPLDEESRRGFISGAEPALEEIGISATRGIELAAQGLVEILAGRMLTKDELGVELARWIAPHLSRSQQATWKAPSWYASGQSLGESLVRFILPVLSLQGLCCHTVRKGSKAYVSLTSEWLGHMPARVDTQAARAGLVRRYLGCYGPSTPRHLAEWAGISPLQAAGSWKLVEDELVPVGLGGQETWLLQQDVEVFLSPPEAQGIRFLPPHDPFLQLRDRGTFVPDVTWQRRIWRAAGSPGAILADGRLAGTWRAREKGRRMEMVIDWVSPDLRSLQNQIEDEAASLAAARKLGAVDITYSDND